MYGSNSEWGNLTNSQPSNPFLSNETSIRPSAGFARPSNSAGFTPHSNNVEAARAALSGLSNANSSNAAFSRTSSIAGVSRASSNAAFSRASSNAAFSRASSNAGMTPASSNVEAARMALSGLMNSSAINAGISRPSNNASLIRHSNNVEAARLALKRLTSPKFESPSDSSSRLAELAQTVASMELQLRRPNEKLRNSTLNCRNGMGVSAISTPNLRKQDKPFNRRTSFCENFEQNFYEVRKEIVDEDTPMKSVWSSSSLRKKTPNSSFVNVEQAQGEPPIRDSYQGNAEWGDVPVEKSIRSMDPAELIKTIQRQRAIRKERSNQSLTEALKASLTRSFMSGQNLTTQFDLKRPQLSEGQLACKSTIPTLPSEESFLSMGTVESELSDMTT